MSTVTMSNVTVFNRTASRSFLIASLTVMLAACSPDPVVVTPKPDPVVVVTPPVKTKVTLGTANSAQFGAYVADSAGNSLYLFIKDTKGAGASTCLAACAATWPALTLDASKESLAAASGLTPALLGSFVRADNGQTQATYNGWPLYRFSKDLKPGDTNGENFGGTWFLIKPDGSRNSPPTAAVSTFTATLSSANEVPAITAASSGSGSVTATFDGMNLTIKGSFAGMTGVATMVHIHGPASKTATAPVMFPLTFTNDAAAGSGTLSGTFMLMDDQVTALKNGQLYVNVHTAANKGGELRGQLEVPTSGGGGGGGY